MHNKILLINDMAGYGKVALSAMIPVLSHMKYQVFNLPTALVSNTLDYGKFDILETTEYMRNSIGIWEELGFGFDAVSTGFIVSKEQVELVSDFCRKQSEKGVKIFADPIMGDDGRLYNGITDKTVGLMRNLISVADYIVPNYTEAAYLAGAEYQEEGITRKEASAIMEKLAGLGVKSIIMTSTKLKEEGNCVVGYDYGKNEEFVIPFEEVPVRFPGTGDIFSAVFMGRILGGNGIYESTQTAMDSVRNLILHNKDNVDKYKGIPVENCLDILAGQGKGMVCL